jgi:hypothetical protein
MGPIDTDFGGVVFGIGTLESVLMMKGTHPTRDE